MRHVLGAGIALLLTVVLVLSPMLETPANAVGLNTAALPPEALEVLDPIVDAAAGCPELPIAWLVAQIEVESGFNPTAVSPVGAAGLLQMLSSTWQSVGGPGGPWPESGPTVDHPVFDPTIHLPHAVRFLCSNLRAMTAYLAGVDKPITPLQAMAVCHVAGCSRVLGSADGIPVAGEADCDASCVEQVVEYVERIEELFRLYSAAGAPILDGTLPPPPVPWYGGATGCVHDDPTTSGCLTGAALHGYRQLLTAAGGSWQWGVGCWDLHAWNPRSDHPNGRACDAFLGRAGTFPEPALVAHGWTYAEWLRTYAGPLQVSYIIWQGRIWSASQASEGWRVYTGGGVYDPSDPTGGHYDHIHVSWRL